MISSELEELVGYADRVIIMNSLGWLVTIEAPADMVDEQVESQAKQIYGLGILGSLGTALLLAFIWASLVSRSHRATAQHFKHLYTLIRQQKIMVHGAVL